MPGDSSFARKDRYMRCCHIPVMLEPSFVYSHAEEMNILYHLCRKKEMNIIEQRCIIKVAENEQLISYFIHTY